MYPEGSMRIYSMIAAAIVIAAIAFEMKSALIPGRADSPAVATSDTLSPHEMHLNYKGMKELPVHEVKEPF
jgi:hypothetical protein